MPSTVPLIPRAVLFGNPERASPQISPDGKYLAYLAPDERNVLQVWMRTVGATDDRVLTADPKRGIRSYTWAYDGRQLLYIQDSDGDEDFHVYAVDVHTRSVRDLTPYEKIRAQLVAGEPCRPGELLVGINRNDPRKHDVYRVDLDTAEVTFDTENPGNILGWTADTRLQVRAALASTPDGGFDLLMRQAPDESWQTLRHWGPEDEGWANGFSLDGNTLYVTTSENANAQRLMALDLETGREEVVAEDPAYDLSAVLIHPTRKTVQAVAFHKDRLEWLVLDPEVAPDFEALRAVCKGDLRITSRDLEDRTWLVGYSVDDGPTRYYAYHRATRSGEFLFTDQPKLEGLPLASMQPISYTARDGLTIHGYLTLPVGVEPVRLSTVLLVHGGPWARDVWGFNATAQWLANRGYAVLQVNYRGSEGYGKQFLHAGDREWAGKMHLDLIDAVEWLVGRGTADREKIAIMGGSYGGYATLVGLTFTPEVFAAGVDIVGPSSLITLMKTIPPYWEPARILFYKRVGNLETEEEFLKSRSPLFFADRICRPLLIAQGANDPRVKQAESEQIVEAMHTSGKPVEYIVYSDEGHGFARPENRLHFYSKTEEFLARYLGGRCEAEGEIEGHSGTIRAAA